MKNWDTKELTHKETNELMFYFRDICLSYGIEFFIELGDHSYEEDNTVGYFVFNGIRCKPMIVLSMRENRRHTYRFWFRVFFHELGHAYDLLRLNATLDRIHVDEKSEKRADWYGRTLMKNYIPGVPYRMF